MNLSMEQILKILFKRNNIKKPLKKLAKLLNKQWKESFEKYEIKNIILCVALKTFIFKIKIFWQ